MVFSSFVRLRARLSLLSADSSLISRRRRSTVGEVGGWVGEIKEQGVLIHSFIRSFTHPPPHSCTVVRTLAGRAVHMALGALVGRLAVDEVVGQCLMEWVGGWVGELGWVVGCTGVGRRGGGERDATFIYSCTYLRSGKQRG